MIKKSTVIGLTIIFACILFYIGLIAIYINNPGKIHVVKQGGVTKRYTTRHWKERNSTSCMNCLHGTYDLPHHWHFKNLTCNNCGHKTTIKSGHDEYDKVLFCNNCKMEKSE